MPDSNTRETQCLIWPEQRATQVLLEEWIPEAPSVLDSPRAGGSYKADTATVGRLRIAGNDLTGRHRAKITTWLVDQRRLGNTNPTLTRAVIDAAETARPLSVHERADRLLRFLADETANVGETVRVVNPSHGQMLGRSDVSEAGRILWLSLAHSESTGLGEVNFLQEYLIQKGWIALYGPHGNGTGQFVVTVEGYERIAEQEVNRSSDQVFVAMWFDPSMNDPRDNGIKKAILNTGYAPRLIDEKPDVDKIDDEIIGEIRRSKFLIADFTHGDKGIRGGVYYEAGFALGLGLEVIRSCRADQIEALHFDVNHHYHIAWNTPEELREGLERRILALVGEGPNRENIPPQNAS